MFSTYRLAQGCGTRPCRTSAAWIRSRGASRGHVPGSLGGTRPRASSRAWWRRPGTAPDHEVEEVAEEGAVLDGGGEDGVRGDGARAVPHEPPRRASRFEPFGRAGRSGWLRRGCGPEGRSAQRWPGGTRRRWIDLSSRSATTRLSGSFSDPAVMSALYLISTAEDIPSWCKDTASICY